MKPTSLSMIVAALLLAVSASLAANKPDAAKPSADKDTKAPAKEAAVKETAKDAKAKPAQAEKGFVTGSYIRQKVTRNGVIASAGPSPLIVIDSETIRRTGASSIPDLFRRGGWAH